MNMGNYLKTTLTVYTHLGDPAQTAHLASVAKIVGDARNACRSHGLHVETDQCTAKAPKGMISHHELVSETKPADVLTEAEKAALTEPADKPLGDVLEEMGSQPATNVAQIEAQLSGKKRGKTEDLPAAHTGDDAA